MNRQIGQRGGMVALLAVIVVSLSGCGILFGGGAEEAPTPTAPARTLVPTFTPTPVQPQAPTSAPVAAQASQVITLDVVAPGALTDTESVTGTVSLTGTAAVTGESTLAPAPTPNLEVEDDLVNVRVGPGTNYGLAGTVNRGERYAIQGRSQDKQWYLICCVNGQEVWVLGDLTDPENADGVPFVEAPVQQVQAPAQAPAAQPAQEPVPAQPEPTAAPEPAPAPAADACAGIGGDGCKFKLRGGPSFADNGGNELKFQLHFIHSGIEGGQPQGSYFVWVEKDGQKLPISDGVRSIALQDQQGALGEYNYEYKVGRDQLPGSNVAGNYVIWVLDGTGERDSQTFSFSVPEGQGEVWMQFDQG